MKTYPDLFKEEMILDKPIKLSDIDEGNLLLKKLWYLTWLVNKKDILLGAIIGEVIPHDLIPEVYKQIIEEAIQLAKQ
ncbi:MAG: hypothetical protein IPN60_18680 [Saprospiraceae bacterium]|nr:hypothetical protein [Candidatus Opimibacter skivensis]